VILGTTLMSRDTLSLLVIGLLISVAAISVAMAWRF
jgi:hypothetical protein